MAGRGSLAATLSNSQLAAFAADTCRALPARSPGRQGPPPMRLGGGGPADLCRGRRLRAGSQVHGTASSCCRPSAGHRRGWPAIAGRRHRSLVRSVGCGDDAGQAGAAVAALGPGPADVLVAGRGLGQHRLHPAAQAAAKRAGGAHGRLANNPSAPSWPGPTSRCCSTPARFLAGSTRMTAGTAQRRSRSISSTQLADDRAGQVYQGLMVNVAPANPPSWSRAQPSHRPGHRRLQPSTAAAAAWDRRPRHPPRRPPARRARARAATAVSTPRAATCAAPGRSRSCNRPGRKAPCRPPHDAALSCPVSPAPRSAARAASWVIGAGATTTCRSGKEIIQPSRPGTRTSGQVPADGTRAIRRGPAPSWTAARRAT